MCDWDGQMVGLCQHSPAVFYQVMHDFIQDLFKKGCSDPEVLDGLRRQVGQLRHLAHVLWDALDLISSLEVQRKRQEHHQLIPEHCMSPGHSWHLVGHKTRVSVVTTVVAGGCPGNRMGTWLWRLLSSSIPPLTPGPCLHLKTDFTKPVSSCKYSLEPVSASAESSYPHAFSTGAPGQQFTSKAAYLRTT